MFGFASPVLRAEVVELADLYAGQVGHERADEEHGGDHRRDCDDRRALVGLERLERLAGGLVLCLGLRGACLALRGELFAAVARALLALAPLGALSLP